LVDVAIVPTEKNVLNTSASEEEEETLGADCKETVELELNRPSESDDDYETVTLCKSSSRKINPNDLIREKGYDIEDSDRFSQFIEVNVCDQIDAPCNMIAPQPFRKAKCRQRYMNITLKVTLKNNKSFTQDFSIPSQCECVVYSSRASPT
jgi:hypothetical protein